MQMSKGGRDRCVKLEGGYRLKAYPDEKGIPTIGAGHIRNVRLGMEATVEQCEAWFADDIRGVEQEINDHVKVTLNQNQFDALCIWEFNTGGLRFMKGGKLVDSAVLKALNSGNYELAIDNMQQWKYITMKDKSGKVLKKISNGLVNRRAQEAIIWSTPAVAQSGQGQSDRPAVSGTQVVPEPPPTKATSTPTGKAQIGAIGAGLTALAPVISSSVESVRSVADPVKEALGLSAGYSGILSYLVIAGLAVSICLSLYTLWHQKQTLSGNK